MVPTTTARAQLGNHRFLEGIGAHCPSAFTFLSAKIPAGCRRSRGRAIQRGRGPARLRRGHELGGRVGPAHQTAPGSASRVRIPRTACALVCLSARAGLLLLPGLTAGVGVVQVARGAAELHGVEEAVAPARVKRVGRRVGGAKSCRWRSPSCLGGADSPSCGLRASGHLGIKLPPESVTGGDHRGLLLGLHPRWGGKHSPHPVSRVFRHARCPRLASSDSGPHPTGPSVGEGD